MMKKYIKLLLVFTLFLLPNVVFADSIFGGTNRHILTVERLNVVNSKITFEGYSFISHMDNLGIMTDDGFDKINGNLQTYLIVYVGNWKDIYGENTEIDIDTCEKNSNCYIKAATMVPRSFFYSRCTDAGCANYNKIKAHRERIGKLLNDTSCHYGEDNYDLDGDGNKNDDNECLYENVGFTVSVDIASVVDGFTNGNFNEEYTGTDGNGIKFKIMAYNTGLKKGLASGFNIHSGACNVNDSLCSTKNVKTASYEFDLNDFASTVKYDATQAVPYTYNNANKVKWEKHDGVFKAPNETYYVVPSTGNLLNYFKSKRTKSNDFCTGCGDYEDMFVLLDTVECIGGVCPDNDNERDGIDYYYAPANHVIFDGEFKINIFKILMKKIECSDIGVTEASESDKKVECGQTQSFRQCKRSGNNWNSVSGTIYYYIENAKQKVGSGELSCSYGESLINGKCYLPVTVSADVLIIQEGKFSFETFTPDIVSAGKSFSFKSATGGITYENNVSFLIAGKYNNPNDSIFYNTPYITFNTTKYKLKENATGYVEDLDFNIDEEVRKYYSEYYVPNKSMHEISKFYYYNDKGIFQVGNSLEAASFALGNSFFISKAKNYDNIIDNDVEVSDKFEFESCDSNSSFPECEKTSVNGSWTEETKLSEWLRLEIKDNSYQRYIYRSGASPYEGIEYRNSTEHRGFGKIVSKVYKYSLPHAYVVLSDTIINSKKYKNGDKIYSINKLSDTDIATYNLEYVGNRYYVGFKYVHDKANEYDFPFNIVNKDISFVEDMTWNLTGICGVEVKNKFYKKIIPQCSKGNCSVEAKISYKFRPISLSNPFPKPQSIAINWKKWIETNPEVTRIKDTKDYGVKYSIRLSKFDIDDAVMLSNINSYSLKHGSYDELNGYEVDGSGAFINKSNDISFSIKQGTTSYCGLGYFSSNCDQYANIMG